MLNKTENISVLFLLFTLIAANPSAYSEPTVLQGPDYDMVLSETPFTPTPTPIPLDTDGDGISDHLEGGRFPVSDKTNPFLRDSDGDGLWDGVEDANRNGIHEPSTELNPRALDTDEDGFEDGIEVLLLGSNSQNPVSPAHSCMDRDGDGLPEELDPDDQNPDHDGDRILDGYEAVTLGLFAVSSGFVKPSIGDVNNDRFRDNADAQLVLLFFTYQYHILPPTWDSNQGDYNRDAFIDNADAQWCLNFFAHHQPTLPVVR